MKYDIIDKPKEVKLVDASGNPLTTTSPRMNTFELKVYEKTDTEENKYLFSTIYNLPALLRTISAEVPDDKTNIVIMVKIQGQDKEVEYATGTKEELLERLKHKVINSNDAMVAIFATVNEVAHFSTMTGILATVGFSKDDNMEIKGFGFLSPGHDRNPLALKALVDSADNHNTAFRDGLKKEHGIDITDKIIRPR